MMAAITAAKQLKNTKKLNKSNEINLKTYENNNDEVILIEKGQTLGKKLLITGKGRCNITSSLSIDEFIKNTPGNGKFLFSSYKQFTNQDIIDFLKSEGLDVKEERGHRVFPVTDNSHDVLNCFIKALKRNNVKIIYDIQVKEILISDNNTIVGVKTNKNTIYADKVILATGGKSYPLTGSTGDGYEIAKKLGHNITLIKPSLIPLEIYEKNICKELQGLSLKNVSIKIVDTEKNKKIFEDFGEMLFTHFGVSGPIILTSSAHLVRYKNIDEKYKNRQIKLFIDFKPALSEQKLDNRILRDFEQEKNKEYKNSLDKLLPQKLIPVIVELSKIDPYKEVNIITKEERKRIINLLKNFELTISDTRPIDEAIITSGGIKINEINPKTMESKIIKNLFIAGELIDVDAYTGGFNLQIAYSTGYVAGKNAALDE